MAARKLTLEALNARLKAGCIGVSVLRRGDRLWLQATLPPKPGAKQNYDHHQQVPLGIYANPDGLKEAENHAIEMGALIARGTFRWIEFNTGVQGTCQAWASRYQTYLKDNKLKGDKDFQWRENYSNPALKWLPQDQALTDEAVIAAA